MMLNMDAEKLLHIDEDLTSKEVAELKFLCTDLLQKKRLETVSDAKDLFKRLDEQGLLDDGLLIPELLITIGRLDLLSKLDTSRQEVEGNLQARDVTSKGVSPYRKMLYKLSEGVTEENLDVVKFLVDLPKSKLATSSSFLDIMIEMEKQQMLREDKLDELQRILENCDKQLANMIKDFKNMYIGQVGGRPPLQEVSNHEPLSRHYSYPIGNGVPGSRRVSLPGSNLVTDSQPPAKDDEKEYYTVSHHPIGYCVIINNYNFERCQNLKLRNRRGTEKDKEDLKRVFAKMHFEVEVQDDLTASDMLDVVDKFSKRDHTQMDIFVCCVLSHGEKGTVLGVDGESVEIHDLTLPFAKCHTLASKPKLFFIQACQGSLGQEAVWTADGQEESTEEGTYEEDAHKVLPYSLPIEADFLIGMATVEHYQSFRHTKDGSIYIQELCRQLENLCPKKEDILSILTKVNHEVSAQMLNGHKQMPEPRYTLRKKLILPMD